MQLSYSHDHEKLVFDAIKSGASDDYFLLKDFFSFAKNYALSYWQGKYPRLDQTDWDFIFANVDFKIITRIKKGLQLQDGTKLTSYYTTVAGFAILDFIQDQSKSRKIEIEEVVWEIGEPAEIEDHLDSKESALIIKKKLIEWVGNEEQVKVLLLLTKGYSYKEILDLTNYKSETACRNAVVKGKKKIIDHLKQNPNDAQMIKELLIN
jgi:DNA-directed RNA polymerase specialized sigma24 family protein